MVAVVPFLGRNEQRIQGAAQQNRQRPNLQAAEIRQGPRTRETGGSRFVFPGLMATVGLFAVGAWLSLHLSYKGNQSLVTSVTTPPPGPQHSSFGHNPTLTSGYHTLAPSKGLKFTGTNTFSGTNTAAEATLSSLRTRPDQLQQDHKQIKTPFLKVLGKYMSENNSYLLATSSQRERFHKALDNIQLTTFNPLISVPRHLNVVSNNLVGQLYFNTNSRTYEIGFINQLIRPFDNQFTTDTYKLLDNLFNHLNRNDV